jgi:hypothetical protein
VIISHKYEFVMATPTKCGTHTVESVVKRMNKYGDDSIEIVRPAMHRMDPPSACRDYYKMLLVRNPYDRLASVYYYFLDPVNYSQWGAKFVQGFDMSFDVFVRWFTEAKHEAEHGVDFNTHRSPHLWTLSLKQNWDILNADEYVKIEDINWDWPDIMADIGVPDDVVEGWPEFGHANRTRLRKQEDLRLKELYSDVTTLAIADEVWCNDDCYLLDYSRPW